MIGNLKGEILRFQDGRIILEVGGVGYEVTVTGSLDATIGRSLSLIIHTEVRENDISLFGFEDTIEKEVFRLLKKVKGIGAKLAMSILSELGAERVLAAVGRGEAVALHSVSGVGKKTAERIIVELRESVNEVHQPTQNLNQDVLLALEKLGFQTARAEAALEQALLESGVSEGSGDLLRLALARLS